MHMIQRTRRIGRQDIDHAAEQARLRHLTGLAGQDLVYAEKLNQAKAYLAAIALDAGAAVPLYLQAEVSAAGGTAAEVAANIIAVAASFHAGPGPAIEEARRAGKLAVAAAADADAVAVAVAAAVAELGKI